MASLTHSLHYMKTAEAAVYLGLSRQYLETARHRGDGPPYIKIGRAVRYRRHSLDQFMLRRETHIRDLKNASTRRNTNDIAGGYDA